MLQRSATTQSLTGIDVAVFEQLRSVARQYHAQVLRLYARTPFPDLAEALELLNNCTVNLTAEREMTQRRVQAVNFCRNAARLVAEALSRPLQPPEEMPVEVVAPPAPPAPRRARRAPAEVPAPPPPAASTVVADAHAKLVGKRANLAAGERTLDQLDALGVDVAEAHSALEEYENTAREDYESGKAGAEAYKTDRQKAWDEFLEALKSTEEPEVEEE